MTTTIATGGIITDTPATHEYHAHAQVFHGHLHRPIDQKIESQAPVKLADRRGGHFTRYIDDFSIEGFVTFAKGQTRVSGARSSKTNGWVTLSTSTIERMNVFEVITADRIVAQLATEHAYVDGHIPSVTFLGTQFQNLQVSGFPVTLKLNLRFLGDRPAGGKSYLRDQTFLESVKKQVEEAKKPVQKKGEDGVVPGQLPTALQEQYDKNLRDVEHLIEICDVDDNVPRKPITCSLVQSIDPIPIPGVESFGNVLVVPHFGTVALGEVEIGEKLYDSSDRPCVYFEYRSIQMNMGCPSEGPLNGPTAGVNGQTHP